MNKLGGITGKENLRSCWLLFGGLNAGGKRRIKMAECGTIYTKHVLTRRGKKKGDSWGDNNGGVTYR